MDKRRKLDFEDVSGQRKSEVWNFFRFSHELQQGQCQLCNSKINAKGSSTTGLITHLKAVHKIEIKKCVMKAVAMSAATHPKVGRINDFYSNDEDKKSLKEVLSRLTALDGLSFHVIATSEMQRLAFRALGYILPVSPQTCRDHVVEYSCDIKKVVAKELEAYKVDGGRFSISFDEYTSIATKRFMNLNVHFEEGFHSLGMIHVQGTMPATKAVQLVKAKLQEFGLNLDSDIIGSVTDGASVMKKFGKDTKPIHQQCYVHGIQLAVCDILYKKLPPSSAFQVDGEEDQEIDDAEEEYELDEDLEAGFVISQDTDQVIPDLAPAYTNIIAKVRKLVRIFRKSPVQNDDALQPYILEKFGKEMKLLLDSRTRWSSLVNMLERFYDLKTEIKMAMVKLGKEKEFTLSEEELKVIGDLISALKPLQVAVEALCQRDSDLLYAEKVFEFTRKKLSEAGTDISAEVKERFDFRIDERRNIELVQLMKYLVNPDYLSLSEDQFGHKIRRPKIANLATTFHLRLFGDGGPLETEKEVLVKVVQENVVSNNKKSLAQELHQFMNMPDNEGNDQLSMISESAASSQIIKKEMTLFEASKTRPVNLEKLFRALKSIPPTSVESERSFSSLGLFANKIRNRLNPETLDALSFLRQYFIKTKNT
jgi:hypothetical protein